MKKLLVFLFIFIGAGAAPADEPFFVHMEDAVVLENGKIMLICDVRNSESADIVALDVTLYKGLTVEKTELHEGWGLTKQSGQAFKIHTAGRLRPMARGKFRVTVSGDFGIFRGRTLENLMLVTAQYPDGRKRTFEVGAPLLRTVR